MSTTSPLPPLDTESVENALLSWFEHNRRPLPWREHYSPYGVWISEIMLQQTQMERGVAFYQEWMRRFPDIPTLAAASEDAVLKAWEGLGYYSRAQNILKAAHLVMERHHGVFPADVKDIRALPGIGPYTAAAIASIAFGVDVACVDANVERVVSRLFDLDVPVREKRGRDRVAELATLLLQKGKARWHNQAMMELGALVCGKKPHCPACPLTSFCLARKNGTQDSRPVLPRPADRVFLLIATGVLVHQGLVYVQKRMPHDVWGGLWEFPGGGIEEHEKPEEAVVREFGEETGFAVRVEHKLGILRHTYTKYHCTLHCFALSLAHNVGAHPEPPALREATDWRWLSLDQLEEYAMPTAHRRLARSLSMRDSTVLSTLTRPQPGLLPLM